MVEAAALLFCDLVYRDPASRKITLLGIFTGLRASRFPSPFRTFAVFAELRGEPGDSGLLTLTCTDAITEEELSQDEISILFADGQETISFALQVREFRFPKPGPYRYVLQFGGESIAEKILEVREGS